jgi:hypothetical protein
MEMQRLVKYPLLLEAIAKYTTEPSVEFDRIILCSQRARDILTAVNNAKQQSENMRR